MLIIRNLNLISVQSWTCLVLSVINVTRHTHSPIAMKQEFVWFDSIAPIIMNQIFRFVFEHVLIVKRFS